MNLYLCKTPMQILRALQLTFYREDGFEESDICIFDVFEGACGLSKRLENTNLFHNVYFIDDQKCEGKFRYYKAYIEDSILTRISHERPYDSITMFNSDTCDSFAAYNILRKKKKVDVYYVEDAPNLYLYKVPSKKNVIFHNILGLHHPIFHVDRWYFSLPDQMLLTNKSPAFSLKPIDKTDLRFVGLVNAVFDYASVPDLSDADVLIMEESLFTDGVLKNDEDLHIYKRLKDEFKELNFMVKLHPRTKVNRFSEMFNCIERSTIPWEVYLMNENIEDTIFVSMACTTMLSPKLLFGVEFKSIMICKMVAEGIKDYNGRPYFNDDYLNVIEKIRSMYSDQSLFGLPENENELIDIICSWKGYKK